MDVVFAVTENTKRSILINFQSSIVYYRFRNRISNLVWQSGASADQNGSLKLRSMLQLTWNLCHTNDLRVIETKLCSKNRNFDCVYAEPLVSRSERRKWGKERKIIESHVEKRHFDRQTTDQIGYSWCVWCFTNADTNRIKKLIIEPEIDNKEGKKTLFIDVLTLPSFCFQIFCRSSPLSSRLAV